MVIFLKNKFHLAAKEISSESLLLSSTYKGGTYDWQVQYLMN